MFYILSKTYFKACTLLNISEFRNMLLEAIKICFRFSHYLIASFWSLFSISLLDFIVVKTKSNLRIPIYGLANSQEQKKYVGLVISSYLIFKGDNLCWHFFINTKHGIYFQGNVLYPYPNNRSKHCLSLFQCECWMCSCFMLK